MLAGPETSNMSNFGIVGGPVTIRVNYSTWQWTCGTLSHAIFHDDQFTVWWDTGNFTKICNVVAPMPIPFTDQGQTWHVRVNLYCALSCQISSWSVCNVPVGWKTTNLTKLWILGASTPTPSPIRVKRGTRQQTHNLCFHIIFHFSWCVTSLYRRFPDNHFPGQTFPGQDLSRTITFPDMTFPGKTFPGQVILRIFM